MKKQILFIFILLFIAGSVYAKAPAQAPSKEIQAFIKQQRAEDLEFQRSIKGMSPEQRKIAIKNYLQKRTEARKAFLAKQGKSK